MKRNISEYRVCFDPNEKEKQSVGLIFLIGPNIYFYSTVIDYNPKQLLQIHIQKKDILQIFQQLVEIEEQIFLTLDQE